MTGTVRPRDAGAAHVRRFWQGTLFLLLLVAVVVGVVWMRAAAQDGDPGTRSRGAPDPVSVPGSPGTQ
jgi:hypothetical protein